MRGRREGGLSATTKVKVYSPEIVTIARGQGIHCLEASIATRVKGECVSGVPGSKSVAGNSTAHIGTWENGAADKAAIQRVRVPPCQLPDSGT